MQQVSVLLICGFVSLLAISAIAETGSQQQPPVGRAEMDKALSDLNDTLTKARAIPNFESGKPTGNKVVSENQGGVYQKLELKDGDVITGANGQPVNDPQQALEMSGELKDSNRLEIIRHGQPQTVGADDGDRYQGDGQQIEQGQN